MNCIACEGAIIPFEDPILSPFAHCNSCPMEYIYTSGIEKFLKTNVVPPRDTTIKHYHIINDKV